MRWEGSAWVGFAASVVPLAAATGVLSAAGASWLAPHTPRVLLLPTVLLAALCFLGLHLVAARQLAAVGLLLAFGGLVGLLLAHWVPSLARSAWERGLLAGIGLLLASFVVSQAAPAWLRLPLRLLWFSSWAYLLGWVVLGLWRPDDAAYRLWAAAGAVIFSAVAAGWFSGVELGDTRQAPRQAAALYLIGLNLVIALVLWFGLPV